MFSQLFLEFLHEEGFLTRQQTRDVAERKRQVKIPIGVLVVNAGLMTTKQVEAVLELQQTLDKRFGEIAVMNGLISAEDFAKVLTTQPKEHVYLSQVLTEWGLMDFDTFLQQSVAFQTLYGLDDEQMARLIDNDVEEFVRSIARISDEETLFREYAVQFLKLVTRLVDRSVLIRPCYKAREVKYKYLAYQKCQGEGALYCCFEPDPEGMLTFARLYSKEPIFDVDELAMDAILEFLNCADGLFTSRVADEGIADFEIEPPGFVEEGVVASEEAFTVLPFRLNCGEFAIFAPVQSKTAL